LSTSDDRLINWILAQLDKGIEHPAGLDEDILTGYVEGRLTPEERAHAETRLAEDPEARTLLATAHDVHAAPKRPWLIPLAVAALLLAGVGLGIHLAGRSGNTTDVDPGAGAPAQQLARLTAELRTAHPDLLGDLRPLEADALAAAGPAPKRGGLQALAPAGAYLSNDVRFLWRPVPGIERYEVSVVDTDGRVLWETQGARPPAGPPSPPLPPGAYVWDVGAEVPLGRVATEQAFTILDAQASARFLKARALLRRHGPTGLLAEAHLALRRDLLAEARDAIRRYLAQRPDETLGLATLALVERRLPSR